MQIVPTELIKKVILAINLNLEGEAATSYCMQEREPLGGKGTNIDKGLPMCGDIQYTDKQTLKEALSHRVEK